jgi:hypothetical protein
VDWNGCRDRRDGDGDGVPELRLYVAYFGKLDLCLGQNDSVAMLALAAGYSWASGLRIESLPIRWFALLLREAAYISC